MGGESSQLKEQNARLEERIKALDIAAEQDRKFELFLQEKEAELKEERDEEARKREEKEKEYRTELKKQQDRFYKMIENQMQSSKEEREKQEKIHEEEIKKVKDEIAKERKRKEFEEKQLHEKLRQEQEMKEKKEREEELAKKRVKEEMKERLRKEIKERRDRIKGGLKPGSTAMFSKLAFPDVLNIGFFGTTGIGKTSLMNSLKFAVEGKLDETRMEQASNEEYQGGHTLRRLRIHVTEHITLIDNRGVAEEDLIRKWAEKELIKQLEGRGSFVEDVQWRKKGSKGRNKREGVNDRIYCTVLVFDARKAKTYFQFVRKFVDCLKEWQGRYPIAVVTNIDRASEENLQEIRVVLKSAGITDFYEVANVTKESLTLQEEYQLSLLKMLERCIKDGDGIFQLRYEKEQRQKKK